MSAVAGFADQDKASITDKVNNRIEVARRARQRFRRLQPVVTDRAFRPIIVGFRNGAATKPTGAAFYVSEFSLVPIADPIPQ